MVQQVEASRRLGEQERLLNYLHAYGGLIVLQVLHVRGGVEIETLNNALKWMQRHHTMARTHVRYGGLVFRDKLPFVYRQPHFETRGTTEIPLRVVEGDWQDVQASELKTPIRRGKTPRLRVTLVRDQEADFDHILLCADHCSIDAQSCNMLSRDLMKYLADPAAADAVPDCAQELPITLEEVLPPKSDSGTRAYDPAVRLPDGKLEPGVRGTRVLSRRFEPDEARHIKQVVANQRTSLHGALSAAFLIAMNEAHNLPEMTCISTVDLRRMCRPIIPNETFGCYIDIIRTRHSLDQDFWGLAKDVSFRIISTLSKEHEPASILKLPDWDVYGKEALPLMMHRRRLDALAITTAGDSGLKHEYGAFRLEGVTMAVSLDFFGPAIMIIACERMDGIDMSMCYSANAISRADVEMLTARAFEILRAQSNQPDA